MTAMHQTRNSPRKGAGQRSLIYNAGIAHSDRGYSMPVAQCDQQDDRLDSPRAKITLHSAEQ